MVFLLLDSLRGSRMRRHLAELGEAQTFDAGQLASWQENKLFRLLSFARDTTDFYGLLVPRSLSPSSAADVLSSLPIVTRQLIRAEAARFVSRAFPGRKLSVKRTSGSTGTPLAIWQDRDCSLRQKAEVIYFGGWAGYQVGARYLYVARNRPRVRAWLRNEMSLWCTHPDERWFEHLARQLQVHRVETLIAHPSVLIPFARYVSGPPARLAGTLSLRGVISISEPLGDGVRLRIEEALGCPVLRRYSTREMGIIASECEERRYHVNVGSCWLEYLQLDEDRPNLDGGPSRAIVTALNSYGMPFIRYDTGDIITPSPDRCTCGRPSPLLLGIQGRVLDSITTPSGRRVEGFDLWAQLEKLRGVDQFQFSQLRDGRYQVSVISGTGYGDHTEAQISERCRRILGESAVVVVKRVKHIDPMPSGKIPLIHREQ